MKIAVLTASRAEYGLLRPVIEALSAEPGWQVPLIVSGGHLAPSQGLTVREIEADGWPIAHRVPMLVEGDTPDALARSLALATIGLSDALAALQPDLLLLLGDRYELLAAAQAALLHRVPLVHLAGGDTSEGAYDESIRHALSKLAHVHAVTHASSAARVRQMGEDPARIHVVGSPGIDAILSRPRLDRAALEASLGAPLRARNWLVTLHPATLGGAPLDELRALQAALDALLAEQPDTGLWITQANADEGGAALNAGWAAWAGAAQGRPQARVYPSLGQQRFLSLLAQVDGVIGNSSSGLYEAPSFGIPTVDIGERQQGRLAADSVIRCAATPAAIGAALREAAARDCRATVNPYGDGHAAERIVALLRQLPPRAELLRKRFHPWPLPPHPATPPVAPAA